MEESLDQKLEKAKLDGIEQGRRSQRLHDVEIGLLDVKNSLKEHTDACSEKSDQVWAKMGRVEKMLYAGFGGLVVLQFVVLALIGLGSWSGLFT